MIFEKLGQGIGNHLGLCAFGAIASGVAIGAIFQLPSLRLLIPGALFLMLYPQMLDLDPAKIKDAVKNPKLPGAALFVNFVISPLLIYLLARAFLADNYPAVTIGLVLYGLVPCGGMVPAFTGMLGGNVTLSVTVQAVSLLMSIVVVPFWVWFLLGAIIQAPFLLIVEYLIMIIIVPLFLADLTRRIVVRKCGAGNFSKAKDRLKALSGFGLILLLFIIFVLKGRRMVDHPALFFRIIGPVASFLIILLTGSVVFGRAVHLKNEDSVALSISTTPKNNAISLALALSAFGGEVAMTNAIAGPLVQFPIMLLFLKLWKSGFHGLES